MLARSRPKAGRSRTAQRLRDTRVIFDRKYSRQRVPAAISRYDGESHDNAIAIDAHPNDADHNESFLRGPGEEFGGTIAGRAGFIWRFAGAATVPPIRNANSVFELRRRFATCAAKIDVFPYRRRSVGT